jgi:hypothetical protein
VKFEQDPRDYDNLPWYTWPEDRALMTGDEKQKEVMVVVRRGAGVDYEEKKDAPFKHGDIRQLPMTWAQISAVHVDRLTNDEDEPVADAYKDVDEDIRTPFYFGAGMLERQAGSGGGSECNTA